MWPLSEYESLHFDNELDVHMSSEKIEANDYGHDLDLLVFPFGRYLAFLI